MTTMHTRGACEVQEVSTCTGLVPDSTQPCVRTIRRRIVGLAGHVFTQLKGQFVYLACLLILISASASFAAYDDSKGFRVAADLLNQAGYLEALAAYQEIVTHSESYDNRAKGLFFMGTIYSLYLDQYDEALRLYAILMRDYSNCSFAQDALFNSGMVLYEKGAIEQAYESFRSYLDKYPAGKHRQSAEVWAESAKAEMGAEKPKPPRALPALAIDDTTLRVLIRDEASRVTFHAAGVLTISDAFSGHVVYRAHGPLNVTARTSLLIANQQDLKLSRCIVAAKDGILAVDGKPYRGCFRVQAENADRIRVINCVDLEDYLYGVVPVEMPAKWAENALKAQAVASRTYAVYIKGKSKDKPYDLVATTASQVYGGYDAETPASNRAVDATRGEIITHNGRLIIAYFHSNSGGFTESAKAVWVAELRYLKGIRDPYSDNIPGGSWELSLSYRTIQDRLNQYGLNVGAVTEIRPVDVGYSGRPLKIAVASTRGGIVLKSNDFRLKIGPMKLKSTLFRLRETTDGLRIRGKGFGHGVGMSQWGAYRMAQAGYHYRDILRHYYTDVEITRLTAS
jgi:stage II sporulation protein D